MCCLFFPIIKTSTIHLSILSLNSPKYKIDPTLYLKSFPLMKIQGLYPQLMVYSQKKTHSRYWILSIHSSLRSESKTWVSTMYVNRLHTYDLYYKIYYYLLFLAHTVFNRAM